MFLSRSLPPMKQTIFSFLVNLTNFSLFQMLSRQENPHFFPNNRFLYFLAAGFFRSFVQKPKNFLANQQNY